MYILIAFFITTSSPGGYGGPNKGIAMQEFASKESCQAAAEFINEQTKQMARCLRK